jgi:hypothetical protein
MQLNGMKQTKWYICIKIQIFTFENLRSGIQIDTKEDKSPASVISATLSNYKLNFKINQIEVFG